MPLHVRSVFFSTLPVPSGPVVSLGGVGGKSGSKGGDVCQGLERKRQMLQVAVPQRRLNKPIVMVQWKTIQNQRKRILEIHQFSHLTMIMGGKGNVNERSKLQCCHPSTKVDGR